MYNVHTQGHCTGIVRIIIQKEFLPEPCPCGGRPHCWRRPKPYRGAAPGQYPLDRAAATKQLTTRAPCSKKMNYFRHKNWILHIFRATVQLKN